MFLLGFLATFLVFQIATFVYVWLQAVVGRCIGATVERISVGTGPILYSCKLNGTEWCLSGLPFGGYTTFYGQDESDSHSLNAGQIRFNDTSLFGRALLMTVGPISNGVMGILLILIPVLMQARQIVIDPAAETKIAPASVPHLALESEKSTISGQMQFFDATFVEFWRGLHLFSGGSWGGMLSSFITSGVAARYDIYAWLTCTGIILVGIMIMNLIPVPVLNGGHLVILLCELCGVKLPKTAVEKLHMAGLLAVLIMFVSMCILDIKWIAAHLAELFS